MFSTSATSDSSRNRFSIDTPQTRADAAIYVARRQYAIG
jgi:hypothetical protein